MGLRHERADMRRMWYAHASGGEGLRRGVVHRGFVELLEASGR